jgi:hypothetical protein
VKPDELREIGEKLYGSFWQTKLADAMPVNVRTVRRWLSGKSAIREVIARRDQAATPPSLMRGATLKRNYFEKIFATPQAPVTGTLFM